MFDLDALAAETEGTPFTFRFGGEDYTLPASLDVTVAAMFADGRFLEAFRRLLGDDQWARLEASEAVLTQQLLVKLLDAWGDHIGVTPGESEGSTGSSSSTVEP